MARVAGVDIPDNKRIEVSLTYVFGVGNSVSKKILDKAEINPDMKVKDVPEELLDKVRKIIDEEFLVEGDLRSRVRMDVKRLIDIGTYRGLRHRRNLPVRGQNTQKNARTRKGPVRRRTR